MVGRTNVGGGGVLNAYAYIGVTYPSGSTCTASNGTITLTAIGTAGAYVFGIPEPTTPPEDWTVSCTNGVRSSSVVVTISSQYQVASVRLNYGRLPSIYQEVEYLESSGTQYINTGFSLTTSGWYQTEIDAKFKYLYVGQETHGSVIFGTNYIPCAAQHQVNASRAAKYFFAGTQVNGSASTDDIVTVVINNANHLIYENDAQLIAISSGTYNQQDRPIYLFAYNYSNTVEQFANARIYSFGVKNNSTDVQIMNLVPCYRISDDEPGMYDMVSETFLTNAGTGTFIVGADV